MLGTPRTVRQTSRASARSPPGPTGCRSCSRMPPPRRTSPWRLPRRCRSTRRSSSRTRCRTSSGGDCPPWSSTASIRGASRSPRRRPCRARRRITRARRARRWERLGSRSAGRAGSSPSLPAAAPRRRRARGHAPVPVHLRAAGSTDLEILGRELERKLPDGFIADHARPPRHSTSPTTTASRDFYAEALAPLRPLAPDGAAPP